MPDQNRSKRKKIVDLLQEAAPTPTKTRQRQSLPQRIKVRGRSQIVITGGTVNIHLPACQAQQAPCPA